jgi:hypothetical protein
MTTWRGFFTSLRSSFNGSSAAAVSLIFAMMLLFNPNGVIYCVSVTVGADGMLCQLLLNL